MPPSLQQMLDDLRTRAGDAKTEAERSEEMLARIQEPVELGPIDWQRGYAWMDRMLVRAFWVLAGLIVAILIVQVLRGPV